MKTAKRVQQLALYSTDCCGEESLFDAGDVFSRCPRCEVFCSWNFVEKVISWRELETEIESDLLAA